jgi:dTDP-4-amino-4,6-dideoxygalactose transaminase
MSDIPFNTPTTLGNELAYIEDAIRNARLSGNGKYSELCHRHLIKIIGSAGAFLTPSCTAALEMATILAEIGPGDEVIMPSFTFTSTANAVVLRGAIPVFVDIRPDTLNIDEKLIEEAITPRTKAVMVVHYAGVGCEMETILSIAERHSLLVIEDAAQALYAEWRGRPLGSFGALAAFSFHETKNIVSGEGGALMVNEKSLVERAEIVWEKGTNRIRFKRGAVNKYHWVDVGSSFLPSEITAAFLYAQLEVGPTAIERRLALWNAYRDSLWEWAITADVRLPDPPAYCRHNGHIFYVIAPDRRTRDLWLSQLQTAGINAVIHYIPLHDSPAGQRFGRACGDLKVTAATAERLFRLPLHLALGMDDIARISAEVERLAR